MKIRNGFVANSSSASFILTIKDCNIKELSSLILNEFCSAIQYEFDLKDRIKTYENCLDNYEEQRDYEYIWPKKENLEEGIANLKEKYKYITNYWKYDNKDSIKLIEEIFKFYNITCKENDKEIELTNSVDMFNDYNDVDSILSNIMLYYLHKGKTDKIKFEVIEDN